MRKAFRRRTAFLLAVSLLLTGCGAPESGQGASGTDQGTGTAAEESSTGRYLESEIGLPQEIASMSSYPMAWLQKLDTGELELVEQTAGKYISGDNGETWEHVDALWLTDLLADAYISEIALAPNGAAAVIYDPYDEEEEETDAGSAQETEADTGSAQETEADAGVFSDMENTYEPEYLYVDPEGNTKAIEFQENDNYLHQFWFGKDSTLYAFDMNYNVYETDPESGTMKKLFETEGLSDYVCFTEQYMVVIASKGVTLYDLAEGMAAQEDTVLQDFISENLGNTIGMNTDGYAVVAAAGEQENVIYFAFSGGLYRHVIGGTAVEQVVDGSLSSLGDPMMTLRGMVLLPDNEFLVLYNDAKLYHYVYDPEVPTVPEEQLRVYSLSEDYTIRQAVSLYQKQNPEVYIRYEVGMTGDNGVTAEDAIKNLNTELMSGSGPDILVLDGLPADSYKEKGILADLTELEAGMDGEDRLFPNLVDACRENGKLYALPVLFSLPMIAGDAEAVGRVTDLASLADAVEGLREAYPEGGLLGLRSAEELLYLLGRSSAAAWTGDDGAIDEEKLTEFLTQAARIYEAELAGFGEQEIVEQQKNDGWNYSMNITGDSQYYANTYTGALDVAMGNQRLSVGKVGGMSFDYNLLTTLAAEEEDFAWASWNGQIEDGFLPVTMTGISAGSMDKELVRDFYCFLFGRELQDIELPGGFPVNMASFDGLAENPYGEEMNGSLMISSENADGGELMLDIRWADEESFRKLKETASAASRIVTGDSVIEQTVCEIGPKALEGSASVEDTVAEIVKKSAIYLAE